MRPRRKKWSWLIWGNGASLAAVRDGVSIDTTMGFTRPRVADEHQVRAIWTRVWCPTSQTEGMTAEQFHHMVHAQSGLLGLSRAQSRSTGRLAQERHDTRALRPWRYFVIRGRSGSVPMRRRLADWTSSSSAEASANIHPVRARMCDGLAFLGIQLDQARNDAHEAVISAPGSRVTVRVIHTDEERHIANRSAGCWTCPQWRDEMNRASDG